MKTYIQEGARLEYTPSGAAVASGEVVLVGALVGVAEDAIADGVQGILLLTGVHTLPKATGQAWTQGAKLYFDDTNNNFTTTASGNTISAHAWAAAASGDTTGKVRLQPGAAAS